MTGPSSDAPSRRIYAVADLLRGLNSLLEDRVGRVWVTGEISGLSRPRSGHIYFTLGDERARIRAALFRGTAGKLPFELKDGLEVMVYADVSIYDERGDLQLVVRKLEPRGQGALQLAFEQLRRRLAEEGLFESARKRSLPTFPGRVGVVTSPTSAAIRDVLEVSGLRLPTTPILISPSRVQGDEAERELVSALEAVSVQPGVDVVLLVRGGGSLEDLSCFNSEVLARAVAQCPVPVVTGVGHETDFTIVDWVADVRAPTPSAAAAAVFPDRDHLADVNWGVRSKLVAAVRARLRHKRQAWTHEREVLRRLAPSVRLATQRRRLSSAHHALARAATRRAEVHRAAFERRVAALQSLSPLSVLARGYALVERLPEATLVRRADDVAAGDRIGIRLALGQIRAVVEPQEDENDVQKSE